MSDKYAEDDRDMDYYEPIGGGLMQVSTSKLLAGIRRQAAVIDRLKSRIETLETAPDHLGQSIDKLDCYVARLELRIKDLETWQHDFVMNSPRGGPAGRAMKQE